MRAKGRLDRGQRSLDDSPRFSLVFFFCNVYIYTQRYGETREERMKGFESKLIVISYNMLKRVSASLQHAVLSFMSFKVFRYLLLI